MVFEISPTDRVLIVGRTGSGKSTLARVLSYGYRNLVVIDSKHEEEVARATIVRSAAEFRQVYPQRSTRVVLRPDPTDKHHSDVDEGLGRALQYGRCRIVIHEAVDFATSTSILPQLRRAAKVGRSLTVGLTVCSQRPMGLHNDVIARERARLHLRPPAAGRSREARRHRRRGRPGPGDRAVRLPLLRPDDSRRRRTMPAATDPWPDRL